MSWLWAENLHFEQSSLNRLIGPAARRGTAEIISSILGSFLKKWAKIKIFKVFSIDKQNFDTTAQYSNVLKAWRHNFENNDLHIRVVFYDIFSHRGIIFKIFRRAARRGVPRTPRKGWPRRQATESIRERKKATNSF